MHGQRIKELQQGWQLCEDGRDVGGRRVDVLL